LVEVTVALAREMADLAGLEVDPADVLRSGAAAATFERMVAFQGGRLDVDRPRSANHRLVRAPAGGYLNTLDALALGRAAMRLGAGRQRKEDDISFGAGIECLAKVGSRLDEGQPLLLLHADDEGLFDAAEESLRGAIEVGPEPVEVPDVIIERIG